MCYFLIQYNYFEVSENVNLYFLYTNHYSQFKMHILEFYTLSVEENVDLATSLKNQSRMSELVFSCLPQLCSDQNLVFLI